MSNYFKDIFFSDAPFELDGGYCCIRLRRVPKHCQSFSPPDSGGWNQYYFDLDRTAYNACLKWGAFLAWERSIYGDGTVNNYTYRLPYTKFEIMLNLCKLELKLPETKISSL